MCFKMRHTVSCAHPGRKVDAVELNWLMFDRSIFGGLWGQWDNKMPNKIPLLSVIYLQTKDKSYEYNAILIWHHYNSDPPRV